LPIYGSCSLAAAVLVQDQPQCYIFIVFVVEVGERRLLYW